MQTAEAAVFIRMPSGRDSPKTSAPATLSTPAQTRRLWRRRLPFRKWPAKTNHALMTESSASEPRRKLFHLTYR